MSKAGQMNVPVIDLSLNIPEQELAQHIAEACSEFGFFQVTSHGIPPELVDEYLHQSRLYFALPLDTKLTWKRNDGNARGFFNDELTKQRRDWKEALDFGVPGSRNWCMKDDKESNMCLDGWNQLPSEEILPKFRSTVTRYFDECAKLSDRIGILMAKGMGQDGMTPVIRDLRKNHSSYLRVNYYPLCNELAEDGVKPLGISPHRDAGFLTVLLQDVDCHSLQVWHNEQWITIRPVPGAFTINTGDMAQIWSNGKYKAPLHRVLSHKTKERYSAPFFYNPSYDTRVDPLVIGNDKPLYHPVLWGYYRAVRFAGDLTDLGVEIQIEHFLQSTHSTHVQKQDRFSNEADFETPFSVEKYRELLLS